MIALIVGSLLSLGILASIFYVASLLVHEATDHAVSDVRAISKTLLTPLGNAADPILKGGIEAAKEAGNTVLSVGVQLLPTKHYEIDYAMIFVDHKVYHVYVRNDHAPYYFEIFASEVLGKPHLVTSPEVFASRYAAYLDAQKWLQRMDQGA